MPLVAQYDIGQQEHKESVRCGYRLVAPLSTYALL